MSISVDGRDIAEVYLGSQNTNCITSVPKNINLTFDPLNATVVGSPTNNNGVVSGFSTANYLRLPNLFNPGSNPWELIIKFSLTEVKPSSWHCLIGSYSADYSGGMNLHISGGKIKNEFTSTNSSWDIGSIVGSSDLSANTTYWAKTGWTGSQYYLHLSTNGTDYTSIGTINSTKAIKATQTQSIGIAQYNTATYLRGTVYLSQCYIKINGNTWWKGGTGTVTLKAGSKVYVPNGKNSDGSNRFDEVVIDSDVPATTFNNSKQMHFYHINGRYFERCNLDIIFSGSTAPSNAPNYSMWYDTSTNKMKRYVNGSWNEDLRSLPFCIATTDGSKYTSIDQVFDWCGYIGSTAFVLPGVKTLVPNGFKVDGTYNVIECNTSTVITRQIDGSTGAKIWCLYEANSIGFGVYDKTIQTLSDRPSSWTGGYYIYVKDENKRYVNQNASSSGLVVCGNIAADSSSNKITSMTPATVQPETTCIEIGEIYNGNDLVFSAFKSQTFTFNAGSSLVQYVVPKGCTHLAVDCVASRGGAGKNEGGYGGRVTCNLSVTAGQVLYITVGTIPTAYNNRIYNASDIRIGGTAYGNRVVVAGGGGSSGASDDQGWNIRGGNGGGLTGATGNNSRGAYGGRGGTQSAGGAGGGYADFGQNGRAGELGLGGTSNSTSGCGGAGYYGGGSGGIYTFYSSNGGGGGGGSSYTNPNLCTNVTHTQGYQNGAGYIKITTLKIK